MKFRLTAHAQEEAERRSIPLHLLEAVLDSPQQITQAANDRRTYQSRLDFGEDKIYLVRVIVDESTTPPTVITVYRTSKIAKYWRVEP